MVTVVEADLRLLTQPLDLLPLAAMLVTQFVMALLVPVDLPLQ